MLFVEGNKILDLPYLGIVSCGEVSLYYGTRLKVFEALVSDCVRIGDLHTHYLAHLGEEVYFERVR